MTDNSQLTSWYENTHGEVPLPLTVSCVENGK